MTPQDMQALSQQLERNEGYLASDPDNRNLLSKVVELCLSAGQATRAETHVRAALERQPDQPYLQSMLGHTLLAQQRWKEAADLFGELLAVHRDGGLAYNYALACLWLGRHAEGWHALAPFASGEAPPPAMLTLALRLLHRMGDLDEAGGLIARHRVACGQDAAFLGAASAVCLDADLLEQAAELSEQSLAIARGVDALVVAGSVALARVDSETAVRLFEEALAASSGEARAWAGLGMASMLRQDLVAAISQLERAADLMPGHIGTWHVLGWARLYMGDLAGATAAFQAAYDLDRNFGESHGAMAIVQALSGQREAAEASIARATGLDKHNLSARYARMALDGELQDRERFQALAMKLLSSRQGPFGRNLGDVVRSYAGGKRGT